MAKIGFAMWVAAGCLAVPGAAGAYELKHTANGDEVRWDAPTVAYVVDPSLEAAAPGASAAFVSALNAWSGAAGAPTLSSHIGHGGAKPAFDGQNSVLFMSGGFTPAGNALAVTVSSVDDATGELLDTDIVVNGIHAFAVLSEGAHDPEAKPLATDGAGESDDGSAVFDVQHILAHEIGHSLGLGDDHTDQAATMYALTDPGSAANRGPASDDEAGVRVLYADDLAKRGGCAHSSVAGARSRAGDVWLAFVTGALVLGSLASRRRLHLPRAAPLLACAALLGSLDAPTTSTGGESLSRVVAEDVVEVGGVLQTRLDLVPASCAGDCPHAQAVVWGGTRDGVTQRIGGVRVPRLGETVPTGV